jgi:hypothetical protein
MKLATIRGTYGSGKTPCDVHTMETHAGTWYAVDGSSNVNLSPDPLEPGVDVETVPDVDAFTWPKGVHSLEDLETAVDA